MQVKNSNPCTRCGKERVEGKSYKEEITTFFGTSTIIHTDTVCPDPECQKIVEEKLAEQKSYTIQIELKPNREFFIEAGLS